MKLSTRGKWLTAIAAGIAAYVVFGPKDSDSVETARASHAASARHAHTEGSAGAASATVPVAQSLLALAHRVADASAAGSLFAAHSWYVAPPPPPPAPVDPNPPPPPKPVAPPLPFAYMGSYAPAGAQPVIFLTEGDKVYDVHVGDTLDNTYSVDSFANGVLVFTYKPLNQQQQLVTGGAP